MLINNQKMATINGPLCWVQRLQSTPSS